MICLLWNVQNWLYRWPLAINCVCSLSVKIPLFASSKWVLSISTLYWHKHNNRTTGGRRNHRRNVPLKVSPFILAGPSTRKQLSVFQFPHHSIISASRWLNAASLPSQVTWHIKKKKKNINNKQSSPWGWRSHDLTQTQRTILSACVFCLTCLPMDGEEKRMHPLLRHANTDLDQSFMVLLDSLPTEPHQQTHIKRKSLNPFMSIYGGLGVGLTYIEERCCQSSR